MLEIYIYVSTKAGVSLESHFPTVGNAKNVSSARPLSITTFELWSFKATLPFIQRLVFHFLFALQVPAKERRLQFILRLKLRLNHHIHLEYSLTTSMSDKKPAESKIWELGPESEFRFELDPGQSLAIKVCLVCSPRTLEICWNRVSLACPRPGWNLRLRVSWREATPLRLRM